jgi:hypothetical protein
MRYSKNTLNIDLPDLDNRIKPFQNIARLSTQANTTQKKLNKPNTKKQIALSNTTFIAQEKVDALAYKKTNFLPNKLKNYHTIQFLKTML